MVSNSNICSYLGLLLLLLLHTIDASDTSNINSEGYIYPVLPITATFRGPLDFDCTDGICSYNNTIEDDCMVIFNNGYEIMTGIDDNTDTSKRVIVSNIHGNYSLSTNLNSLYPNANANKCILSCQKCSAIPDTEIDDFGCAGREKCCDTYDGFFYCHELGTCIDTTEQSCPINKGTGTAAVTTTYSGPTSLTCRNGGRCNIVSLVSDTAVDVDQCGLITAGNRSLFGHYFISELEGEYRVPEGCAVSCDDGCSPSSSLVVGNTDAILPTGLVLEPGPVILPSLATSDSSTSEGGPSTNVTDDDNHDTTTTRRRQLRGTIK